MQQGSHDGLPKLLNMWELCSEDHTPRVFEKVTLAWGTAPHGSWHLGSVYQGSLTFSMETLKSESLIIHKVAEPRKVIHKGTLIWVLVGYTVYAFVITKPNKD